MGSSQIEYLHGYSSEEQQRLLAQNQTLSKYIYERLDFTNTHHILEVGCGVGAQMIHLLKKYPDLHITGVDIDPLQIKKAKENLAQIGIPENRYHLQLIDSKNSDWMTLLVDQKIELVYFVWVLEHMHLPKSILIALYKYALPGTRIYATETFHNSLQLHPVDAIFYKNWNAMSALQLHLGGNANVGLQLGNLMRQSGFKVLWQKPYAMFFDSNQPDKRLEMLDYWENLFFSAESSMREYGLINDDEMQHIKVYFEELRQNTESIFYYSFMQIEAVKEQN